MNLTLNEEQRYLKDTARSFFREKAPVAALRKLRDSKDELGYSPELWREIVELGWSGMLFPETVNGIEIGGSGFGFKGLGAILQESGHTLTASPLLSSVVLGGSAILLGGSEAQQQAYLPDLISGEVRYALALEEGAHHDPAACAMTATPTANGYRLSGRKTFVLDGHSAERLIVVARTAGSAGERAGLSLFLVDADTAGITHAHPHDRQPRCCRHAFRCSRSNARTSAGHRGRGLCAARTGARSRPYLYCGGDARQYPGAV